MSITILFVTVLCFVASIIPASSMIVSGSGRRRRERAAYYQRNHVKQILETNENSIFASDYYHPINRPYKNKLLCPTTHALFPDSSPVALSIKQIDQFKKNYIDKVYMSEHFPFTYRDNVYLKEINSEDLWKYHEQFCVEPPVPKPGNMSIIGLFIFVITITCMAFSY